MPLWFTPQNNPLPFNRVFVVQPGLCRSTGFAIRLFVYMRVTQKCLLVTLKRLSSKDWTHPNPLHPLIRGIVRLPVAVPSGLLTQPHETPSGLLTRTHLNLSFLKMQHMSDSPSRVLLQSFFEAVERLYHFRYFEHIGNSGMIEPLARSLVE